MRENAIAPLGSAYVATRSGPAPSSSTPVVAGVGLAVVLVGAGAVFIARRRRTAGQG
ncbi:LAETG motif-containing sortase-dependent surface protein [Streptomyces sp. NBC_01378]|uniref:LAETG motif-containing sortase-dependent surface protein n=1 Tax=Streptomyces sp. NBC_01378 TaxID=2903844 RepID=UPI00386B2560